ncbi:diguanylate cyclase [Ruminococcus flavefaciens]|uniref:Diguanylate cyclase (GGDEF) domain-containing protein n=1 Tax=Ruminococcus flavefaciens TaxID=1265 RepID=A0A1M7IND1_RUMFL|nr:GGDEF domain-containing protein [Ruminococcus flavefaciens]SHM42185.1 diguanylate cyclase (GGDEF) domain-containing protein [Ruminococcus flavefaciens]
MKKRRTIAVIAADVFNSYMNRIFIGISEQCRSLGYDVLTFLMAFNLDSGGLIQQGEENIFSLIKADVIDGVILLAGNLASQNLVDKFVKTFSHWGIPVVALDHDFDFCDSLYAEDTELFEQMTDHFIEAHGCKKIICLTGPEGSPPAMSRLEGYKRSMKKHGLEIAGDDIIFGDFWKIVSQRLAKQFITGERPIPDAVVCANDEMARSLCNSMVKGGYRIPEDFKISGYDGSNRAVLEIPSISTVCPENIRMGANAVCILHKKITGEDAAPLDTLERGRLILARSCGCGSNTIYSVKTGEDFSNRIERFDDYYNKSCMLDSLMEEENLEGLIRRLNGFVYTIRGLDTYMLCLCRNWDNIENENDDDYIREGYADIMEAKMIYTRKHTEFIGREFRSADIIPDFMGEYCEGPSAFFLLPLHYMDRCFGYSIFRFDDIRNVESRVFAKWNRNIGLALEYLRVRTKLMSMNQRILMSSIRDTLTGVYNRKGFKRMAEGILRRACDEQETLLVIMVDLDRLKMINDNFGHIEGDNAITVVANALQSCCGMNEVCARIGGDEYALIGCGDYSEERVKKYFEYIRDYFKRYNAASGKRYEVSASLGAFCGVPEKGKTIDDYISFADEKMYEDKQKRRKQRKN